MARLPIVGPIMERMGLQQRILLYVSIGLLVSFGLFTFLALRSVGRSTELIFQERVRVADTIAKSLDFFVIYLSGEMESVMGTGTIDPTDADLLPERDAAAALADRYREYAGFDLPFVVGYVNASGVLLWTVPFYPGLSQKQTLKPDEVKAVAIRGRTQARQGPLFLPNPNGTISLMMADPGRDGLGLFIIDFDAEGIINALASQVSTFGSGLDVQVVDSKGASLVNTAPDSVEKQAGYQKVLSSLVSGGQTSFATYSGSQAGERGRMIAYAPMRNLPFGVVVDRRRDSAVDLLSTLRTQMIIVGSVAFLLALGGAWVTSRAVVRPLRMLTDASRRIASGDLETPVSLAGGDEVGDLARHFDGMRAQLQSSFYEIQAWNAEMEERVRLRTEELQRRNRELEAASSVAGKIGESLNLQEVLGHSLDKVLEVLALDCGEICVLDEGTQSMAPVAHRGISIEFAREIDRFHPGQDLPGIVMETGAPLIVENLAEDPRILRKLVQSSGMNSAVAFPLVAHGQVVGVMDLFSIDRPPLLPGDFHLLQLIGNQIGVAIRNARLYEEARSNEELRRELLERAINAQEEERKRLARELHDEIGQVLTGLVMSLDGAEATIPQEFPHIKGQLEQLRDLTAGTLGEVRRLMVDLRPTLLDDLGLVPAISWYAENYLAKANIQARVEAVNLKERLPQQVETNLFRIIQEAITNIMKHAEAKKVQIRLERQDSTIHASIEDDGKGFDTRALRRPTHRGSALGIFGMRERVDLLGGSFTVSSALGRGTRLELVIPARPGEERLVQD